MKNQNNNDELSNAHLSGVTRGLIAMYVEAVVRKIPLQLNKQLLQFLKHHASINQIEIDEIIHEMQFYCELVQNHDFNVILKEISSLRILEQN